jgi:hypothetical protein
MDGYCENGACRVILFRAEDTDGTENQQCPSCGEMGRYKDTPKDGTVIPEGFCDCPEAELEAVPTSVLNDHVYNRRCVLCGRPFTVGGAV